MNPSSAPTIKGNLRLSIYSPAIDVGNNDYMTGVHTDIDGRDRVQDGDGDGTEFVDMGAYENGYYEFFIPLVSQ